MGPLRRGEAQRIDVPGPALGLVEVQSIARGITVADAMVKRAQVALTPGRDFGVTDPQRWIRLSFASSIDDLQEAVARLREVLA